MICPRCGATVPGPVFCRSCGARLADAPATPAAQATPTPPRQPQPGAAPGGPAPGRSRTPLYAVIACLLAVVLVGGGFVAWSQLTADEPAASDAPQTPGSGSSTDPSVGATDEAAVEPSGPAAPTSTPPAAPSSKPDPAPVDLRVATFRDAAGDVSLGNVAAHPSSTQIGDMTRARIVPTGNGAGRIEVTFPHGLPNDLVNVYVNTNRTDAPEFVVIADFRAGSYLPVRVGDWLPGVDAPEAALGRPRVDALFPDIPAATGTRLVVPFRFTADELPRKTIAVNVQSIHQSGGDYYDYFGTPAARYSEQTKGQRHTWLAPVRVIQ